jgi:hypothetical protein
MKQFACWFSHGVGNGSELRRTVHAAQTQKDVLESVERFFEHRAEAAGDRLGVTREDPAHDSSNPFCFETARGT